MPAPYGLTNCVLYLTADVPTSLAKTAGETTVGLGDIASGDRIYRWFDQSGHANAANHTAAQLTTLYQPGYFTSGGLNGKPFVNFNAPGTTPTTGSATGSVLTIADATPGLAEWLDGQGTGGPGAGKGSYTVLMLVRQQAYAGSAGSYSTLATLRNGSSQFLSFIRSPASTSGGLLKRYNSTLQAAFDQGVPLGFALTFASNGTANQGTETLYVNDAATPVGVSTTGRPALAAPYNIWYLGAETSTGGKCFTNGEVYEIICCDGALTNGQIAAVYAGWNSKYGTNFGTNVGPLTPGTASASNITQTSQTISATAPLGGTAPYAYQWYRSTAAGSLGSPVSGATNLLLNDSGLSPQTGYYYTLRITDSASAVVDTTQLYAPTHGTSTVRIGFLSSSQFAQEPGGKTVPEAYADLLFAAYPGSDPVITNLAVSGQKVRDIAQTNGGGNLLAGYLTTFATAGVTHCFIAHGGNDATQQGAGTAGYTTADFLEDMTDIVTRLVAAGITPIVCEIPYRSNSSSSDAVVQIYNPLLPTICNGTTILMGDQAVYDEWLANPSLYLLDGLHPTAAGVDRWAQLLLNVTPASMLPPATGFTFTGPPGGPVGVSAGPFTVTPVGGKYTGVVTPSDNGGGGAFSPTSLTFASGIAGQTFNYTPAGASGTRTLTITSSPALTPPAGLLFSTPDANPPVISAAEILASGTQLQITFDEAVVVLDNTKFTVAGKTLSSWSLSGDGLRLTATISTIVYAGAAALSLVVTSGAVEDLSGNDIAAVTVGITNNSTASAVSGVQITPTVASLEAGGQQQFSATVQGSGSPSQAVTYSVLEVGGGTITSLGVYTAPSVPGTYTVQAQSVQDPTKTATATVTVTAATSGGSAAWLTAAEVVAFLALAGITATTGDVTPYLASTITELERSVECRPFLADIIPTERRFTPGRGGLRMLDLRCGAIAVSEVRLYGYGSGASSQLLTEGDHYWLMPQDAPGQSEPYTFIEFATPVVGQPGAIGVTARWGWSESIPDDVFQAVQGMVAARTCRALLRKQAMSSMGTAGAMPASVKEGDAEVNYGSIGLNEAKAGGIIEGWEADWQRVLLSYRLAGLT